MAKHSDIDLMLYADGELSPEEAEGLREQLLASEEDRAKLESLGQVGEVVRGALELSADDASNRMAGLWSRIETEISSERAPARAAPVAAASEGEGLWSRVREFFTGSWGGHLVTGAAAAAVVALVMSRGGGGGETQTVIRDRTAAPVAPVVDRDSLESQAPEVENLEVYDGSGMILTIPGEDEDSSTAVIWISEDHELEGPI